MFLDERFIDFAAGGEVELQLVDFVGDAAQVSAQAFREDAGSAGGDAIAFLAAIGVNP